MMGFEDYKERVRLDALEAIAEGARWFGTWGEMLDVLARLLALGAVSGELEAAYGEARAALA